MTVVDGDHSASGGGGDVGVGWGEWRGGGRGRRDGDFFSWLSKKVTGFFDHPLPKHKNGKI